MGPVAFGQHKNVLLQLPIVITTVNVAFIFGNKKKIASQNTVFGEHVFLILLCRYNQRYNILITIN